MTTAPDANGADLGQPVGQAVRQLDHGEDRRRRLLRRDPPARHGAERAAGARVKRGDSANTTISAITPSDQSRESLGRRLRWDGDL
jgi:hypothetical protein